MIKFNKSTGFYDAKCNCGKPMQIGVEKMQTINHYNSGEIICRDCLIKKGKQLITETK